MAEIIKLNERKSLPQPEEPPIFNVPVPVLALIAALIAVHVVRMFLPEEIDQTLVAALGFYPLRYTGELVDVPGGVLTGATSFLTHAALHANNSHLLFNCVWLLAFGSAIARRTSAARFFLFFAATTIAGAVAYLVSNLGQYVMVIGASGGVAGLMGASMRFFFNALDNGGAGRMREAPETIPLMSLREVLSDRRVLAMTAAYIALNLLAAVGLGTPDGAGGIAWEAHIGGYLAGLLLYGRFNGAPQKNQRNDAPPKRHQPTRH